MASLTNENTSKKRKFASEEETGSDDNRPPQRSSKFWFNDGNIVLETSTTQFKVHRGVLSFQSSVFEDMFSIPQPEPTATDRIVEGCPVVHVTDLTADWEALFGLLYNSERYIPKTHAYPISTMLAMLRLGYKYSFERFKSDALTQLRMIFPRELKEWDKSYEDSCIDANIVSECVFEVLRTIEDLQIQTALPVAYFTCLQSCSLKDIMSGRDSPDGPVYLLEQTRTKLVLGYHQFLVKYPSYALHWLLENDPAPDCLTPAKCKPAIRRIISKVVAEIDDKATDALDPSEEMSKSGRIRALCGSCQAAYISDYNITRRTIWNALPTYFGLPEWEQLKDS